MDSLIAAAAHALARADSSPRSPTFARCRYSQISSAMTLPPGSSSSIAAYGPRLRSNAGTPAIQALSSAFMVIS